MAIRISIDRALADRGLSVGEFANAVDTTPANGAVLKNRREGRALLNPRRDLSRPAVPARRHPALCRMSITDCICANRHT